MPARGRGPAARRRDSPLGQGEDGALRGDAHRGPRAAAQSSREPVERLVGAVGAVVEEHHRPRAGAPRELHRVVADRVPVARFRRELLGEELRIVDQHVGVARELERGGVVLAEPVLARAERGGTVVGQIGERGVPVTDAIPERASTSDATRKSGMVTTFPWTIAAGCPFAIASS